MKSNPANHLARSRCRADDHGDEIAAGKPRRSGGQRADAESPWGDDVDDASIAKPPLRSTMVVAVGVIAIVFGCFVLLGSVCVSVYPVIMPAMLNVAAKGNPNDPNLAKAREAMTKIPTWYLLGVAAVDFLRAMGLIVGGVGVIMRSNVARLLTLVMAALGVVMFLTGVVATFVLGTMDMADPSSVAGGVFGIGCSAVLNLGFAAVAFIFLLSAKNAAEFRS